MEDKYTVYIHTSPSNKAYIGITSKKPELRWNSGRGYLGKRKDKTYGQPVMANAILKYPWETWEHIIWAENLSKEEAEAWEERLIALFKTNNPQFGYNIENGGHINKVSKETRKKLSESRKNIIFSEETRKKMSEARKGVIFSEETRKKISESNKKRKCSEETRKKISEANKNPSEETHRKMSEAKYNQSEETRKKISEAKKGKYIGKNNHSSKKVICLNTGVIYDCMADVEREMKIVYSGISQCCSGKRKSAGKHPITGEPLRWAYVS